MAYLSEEAKAELLEFSESETFREDMRRLSAREYFLKPYAPETVEFAIGFLDEVNRIAGHPRKPFNPITGDHFVL